MQPEVASEGDPAFQCLWIAPEGAEETETERQNSMWVQAQQRRHGATEGLGGVCHSRR